MIGTLDFQGMPKWVGESPRLRNNLHRLLFTLKIILRCYSNKTRHLDDCRASGVYHILRISSTRYGQASIETLQEVVRNCCVEL